MWRYIPVYVCNTRGDLKSVNRSGRHSIENARYVYSACSPSWRTGGPVVLSANGVAGTLPIGKFLPNVGRMVPCSNESHNGTSSERTGERENDAIANLPSSVAAAITESRRRLASLARDLRKIKSHLSCLCIGWRGRYTNITLGRA
jgi:hypothetical protein